MTVVVTHLNNNEKEYFRGEPDQIARQLTVRFPWSYSNPRNVRHNPYAINDVLGRISSSQNLQAVIED